MTRGRALLLAGAAAAASAALLRGWLAPDDVLAFWTLLAFCR